MGSSLTELKGALSNSPFQRLSPIIDRIGATQVGRGIVVAFIKSFVESLAFALQQKASALLDFVSEVIDDPAAIVKSAAGGFSLNNVTAKLKAGAGIGSNAAEAQARNSTALFVRLKAILLQRVQVWWWWPWE